jgi:hypothetical protein
MRYLYIRGAATLLASWEEYARGSAGAALERRNGVWAAVFPTEPERAVYNNALLDRDLGPTERAAAVDAMEEAYNSAGIDRYAGWVHESDEGMRAELSSRGFTLDDSTRAMGMSLDDISLALPEGDQRRSRQIFCAASSELTREASPPTGGCGGAGWSQGRGTARRDRGGRRALRGEPRWVLRTH